LDPPPALAEMQAVSPIGRVRLFRGDEAWVVTTYDECLRLLRLPSLSVDFQSPGYPVVHATHAEFAPGILTHIDPPDHDKYRRMLAAEFGVKRVGRLREQVTAVVHDLFDETMAAGPGVDMMESLALPAPALMICTLLGVPYEERDNFVRLAETFLGGQASIEEARRANEGLRALLQSAISSKREVSGDDLFSRVLHDYVDTGELEEETLIGMAEGVLIAGFHTTSSMIGLGTVALLENPDQFALLREDPELVSAGVEELLRFLSVPHLGRHRATTEEIEVAGQVIPPGEGIILASNIANRDPAHFEDPNSLILSNGDKRTHQAFGSGIHQCVGAALARLELGIFFTALIERMPNIKTVIPFDQLEFTHDSTVIGVHALPIAW